MATVQIIDPQSLAQLIQKNPKLDLIDVRTPAEYESVHAAGARLFPLDRLNPAQIMQSRTGHAQDPLYVICKSGARSAKACEQFIAAGFTNVISVAGGTEAWVQAHLPAESTARRVLPLDRQIQATAGSICLTGAILGALVNPWFFLLCGIVGFGLTLAGLTGFCPMALFLARMPWNQSSATCTKSCCCSK